MDLWVFGVWEDRFLVTDSLFDIGRRCRFFQCWCDVLIFWSACNDTCQWIFNALKFVEICLWDARVKWIAIVKFAGDKWICKSCGCRDGFDGCLGYENNKIWIQIWFDQRKSKLLTSGPWLKYRWIGGVSVKILVYSMTLVVFELWGKWGEFGPPCCFGWGNFFIR